MNESMAQLIARLDEVSCPREEIASALLACSTAAIPALVAALAEGDGVRTSNIAYVLGQMGRQAEEAVPALVDVYNRLPPERVRDEGPRKDVTEAILRIGHDAGLASWPKVGDWSSRTLGPTARAVFRGLAERAPAVIPVLVAALRIPGLSFRAHAIVQILGPVTAAALLEAVPQGDPEEGQHTYQLLLDIGEAGLPVAFDALASEDAGIRCAAASLLGDLPSRDATTLQDRVGALAGALSDSSSRVRFCAARALRQIELAHPSSVVSVLSSLRLLCDDPDPEVRGLAKEIVRWIEGG